MTRLMTICCSVVGVLTVAPAVATSAEDGSPALRQHTEQSFQEMKQTERSSKSRTGPSVGSAVADGNSHYPSDQYLIGRGQGDLSKGKSVCQRVSELSARTDLAKQIRILVKEHMVDRVRERSGKDADQDIELTREEIVQEYLQGVKIVDHQTDDEKKTCSATAVMPKSQIQSAPAPDHSEVTPTVI